MALERPPLTGIETIGELFCAGATGLRVRCRGCRAIAIVPFRALVQQRGAWMDDLVGPIALRLTCRRCGQRVLYLEDVRAWAIADDQPPYS